MIRMKAEAVVISKPGTEDHVNGANVNMNGKVILADVMDKGYKGAGKLNGEVVLCIAEGDREKKVAETAMNILSKHIAAIKTSGDSFQIEAENFFNDASREISIIEGEYSGFSATLVYNFGDSVYIANCGKNAVYTYDETYLTRIDFGTDDETPEENVMSAPVFDRIDSVTPNTKIIVLSKNLYDFTTDEQILSILRGAESVKQACQQLIDQSTENGAVHGVTVLMENLTPVEVPVAPAAADADGEPEGEQTGDDGEAEPEEEIDETRASKAPLVVLILLLILVALIAGLYFGNQKYNFIEKLFSGNTEVESTEDETTVPDSTANVLTISDIPTSSGLDITTATTTEAQSTTAPASTAATSSTTRSATQPTSRRTTSAPTTRAPSTAAPTTAAPTTEAPSSDTPSSDTPSSETPSSETPSSNTPSSETPSSQDQTPQSPTVSDDEELR